MLLCTWEGQCAGCWDILKFMSEIQPFAWIIGPVLLFVEERVVLRSGWVRVRG